MKELIELFSRIDLSKEEAVRPFHGRGGKIPHLKNLTIDYFPSVLFITQYEKYDLEEFVKHVVSNFPEISGVILQDRTCVTKVSTKFLHGNILEKMIVCENGMKFNVDLFKNKNIGFFPDMHFARKKIISLAKDKNVLNLFAFTCSFSVAAMKGGAKSVVNMDMARSQLSRGRENHLLNDLDTKKVKFLGHDILKSFGSLKRHGPYDLVIIDPPSLQVKSFNLEIHYKKIIMRLKEMLNDQAIIFACLNSPFHCRSFLRNIFSEDCFAEIEELPTPYPDQETAPECAPKVILFSYSNIAYI